MLEHEDLRQLISLYFDNEATQAEKDIVEDHILGCASCKQYYQQLSQIRSSVRSIPEETLSPDLEQKINRAISQLKNQEEHKMENKNLHPAMITMASFVIVLCVSVMTVQTYMKRGIQVRMKSASDDIGEQYKAGGMKTARFYKTTAEDVSKSSGRYPASSATRLSESSAGQYEPYYTQSSYEVTKDEEAKGQTANAPSQGVAEYWGGKEKKADSLDAVSRGLGTARVRSEAQPSLQVTLHKNMEIVGYDKYSRADDGSYPRYYQPSDTESYNRINENRFLAAANEPLSTFSIDVDTASFSNVRRFINQGQLPPEEAVRIEEMINYFKYDYPKPLWEPFSITTEVSQCPWQPDHQLVLIGLQGKVPDAKRLPPSNLVFLIDVSGSMEDANKLPLLRDSFLKMIPQLRAEDRISIVTYSDHAQVILNGVPGDQKWRIQDVIRQLSANGSTGGWEGIQVAYKIAQQNFIRNGNNRVILATDGDFNVGASSDAAMTQLIEEKRQSDVFLTVMGFGMGNLKDSKLVNMADKGNGNYFYIDNQQESDKVFVKELGSNLFAIAKDVKIQVEFNPATVKAYRLIGYEKRKLAKEDFNNDAVDAGELGAGHTVTALYEIVPHESHPWVVYRNGRPEVDPLKYQKEEPWPQPKVTGNRELMTIKLRYKEPKSDTSRLIEKTVGQKNFTLWPESNNFRFAAAVAEFGLLLRNSPYEGCASYDHVLTQASQAIGNDPEGYKNDFLNMVHQAQALDNRPARYIDNEPYYPRPEQWGQTYTTQKPPEIKFK